MQAFNGFSHTDRVPGFDPNGRGGGTIEFLVDGVLPSFNENGETVENKRTPDVDGIADDVVELRSPRLDEDFEAWVVRVRRCRGHRELLSPLLALNAN